MYWIDITVDILISTYKSKWNVWLNSFSTKLFNFIIFVDHRIQVLLIFKIRRHTTVKSTDQFMLKQESSFVCMHIWWVKEKYKIISNSEHIHITAEKERDTQSAFAFDGVCLQRHTTIIFFLSNLYICWILLHQQHVYLFFFAGVHD